MFCLFNIFVLESYFGPIQLFEASIDRRLMSVLKVRVSFDVMCLFLDLACVSS